MTGQYNGNGGVHDVKLRAHSVTIGRYSAVTPTSICCGDIDPQNYIDLQTHTDSIRL